jgi:hypothetical protein
MAVVRLVCQRDKLVSGIAGFFVDLGQIALISTPVYFRQQIC